MQLHIHEFFKQQMENVSYEQTDHEHNFLGGTNINLAFNLFLHSTSCDPVLLLSFSINFFKVPLNKKLKYAMGQVLVLVYTHYIL